MSEGKYDDRLSIVERLGLFVVSEAPSTIVTTLIAPIIRIKLLIQNQNEIIKAGHLDRPYKGAVDCFRRIRTEEGIASFWKGNFTNCIRSFPSQSLTFMFRGEMRKIFSNKKTDSYAVRFSKNVMSGGAAGALSSLFVYSLDYARTRLANDVKSAKKGVSGREFNGLIDVYRKTLKTDGVQGLYRGFVMSCVGIIAYRGLYFGLYDTIRPLIGLDPNPVVLFGLGYAVTLTAGLTSYPIDTIYRRMMMTSGQPIKYKGSIDCATQIIQKEGITSLFKGAGVNILIGITGAGLLVGFDYYSMYIRGA